MADLPNQSQLQGWQIQPMDRVETKAESFKKFTNQPGFSRQYTNVYYDRLQQLRQFVQPPKSWSTDAKHVARVLDMAAGELSWVVGTITRETAHKPNIFKDLKEVYHGTQPKHSDKYYSPEDKIFLEDEHGRIAVIGDLDQREPLVTGIVAGLLGAQNQFGEFQAVDICYPTLPPQPALSHSQARGPGPKIALASGFSLEETAVRSGVPQLIDFLGRTNEISRIIVCGNTIAAPDEKLIGSRVMRPQASASSIKNLNRFLTELATILPAHLMPGESDPTTVAFPQMPLHPALLGSARSLIDSGALILETNPQKITIDGTNFLGTSGQPVADLIKYREDTVESNKTLELDLLHRTLLWRHLAPTAPDTLWSYPYLDEDPLVMDELPHVYFMGNASKFATDVRNDVRLICVPSFTLSKTVVLLDLSTLDVELVEFS